MKFDHYEFRIAGHYGSALINGDSSGLTDEEENDLQRLIDSIPAERLAVGHWGGFGDDDSAGFCLCDVSGKLEDCYTARYYFPVGAE